MNIVGILVCLAIIVSILIVLACIVSAPVIDDDRDGAFENMDGSEPDRWFDRRSRRTITDARREGRDGGTDAF